MVPALLGGLLALAVAAGAGRGPASSGRSAFVTMTITSAIWSLGYAFEVAGADLATKVLFAKIEYLGTVSVPVVWVMLALIYTGRQVLVTPRRVALAFLLPSLTVLLVFTTEWHGLVWRSIGWDESGPFPSLAIVRGPWFIVHAAYSYLAIITGSALVLPAAIRSFSLYRWQAAALVAAALLPLLSNAIYLAGLSPIRRLDPTPVAFAVSSLILALALSRFRLFDLVPVARARLFELMPDPIFVLDSRDRIMDVSPSAARLLGRRVPSLIGQPLAEGAGAPPSLVAAIVAAASQPSEVTMGEPARQLEVRTTLLPDGRGEPFGRLVLVRDVTNVRRREQERAELVAQQARLEGAIDATRRMLHLIKNDLTVATGTLQLIERHGELTPDFMSLVRDSLTGLAQAADHARQMQQVTLVKTAKTPAARQGEGFPAERSGVD